MACNCKRGGGHMAPAPKPKDMSKSTFLEKKEGEPQEESKKEDENK